MSVNVVRVFEWQNVRMLKARSNANLGAKIVQKFSCDKLRVRNLQGNSNPLDGVHRLVNGSKAPVRKPTVNAIFPQPLTDTEHRRFSLINR